MTIASYVVAPGSQAAIDRCHLVLWSWHPMLLAGHNYCGWSWIARLRVGTVVHVLSGPARGRWHVVRRLVLAGQGGPMPASAMSQRLILQTCLGRNTVLQYLAP